MLSFVDEDGWEDIKVVKGRMSQNTKLLWNHDTLKSFLSQKNKVVVSEVSELEDIGERGLYLFIARYNYFDKFDGALLAGLPLSSLVKDLERFRLGNEGGALLIDGKGNVLALSKNMRGEDYNREVMNQAMVVGANKLFLPLAVNSKSGFFNTRFPGSEAYVAFNSVEDFDWRLLIVMPASEFRLIFSELKNNIWIIGLLSMVVGTLASWILSQTVVKPLKKLVGITEAISGGDFSQRIDIKGRDEIGVLANSFNFMIDEIDQKQSDLIAANQYIDNILKSMDESLIVLDTDLRIKMVNPAACRLLEASEEELQGLSFDMISEGLIDEESRDPENRFHQGDGAHYVTRQGRRVPILFSASPLFRSDDLLEGYVCLGKDITMIKEAEQQIVASLEEKETLLKEVHHRVKNNMQIIISLLNLQANKETEVSVLSALDESKNRVRAMSLVHETLYRSNSFSRIDFNEYLKSLIQSIASVYKKPAGRVDFDLDIKPFTLNIEQALPCGLVINEIVTNSFKYAYPAGQNGRIFVKCGPAGEDEIEIRISDDGVGLPADYNWKEADTLGLGLVRIIAEAQLRAKVELSGENGTRFSMRFPIKNGMARR